MIKKKLILIMLLTIGNKLFSQFIEIKQNPQISIKKSVPKMIKAKRNLLKDSDGDGISDNIDKCPNDKGTLKNEGCPNTESTNPNENFDNKPKIIEKEAINELN
jgi:hypothetical protein